MQEIRIQFLGSCTDKNEWKESTPVYVLVNMKVLSESVSKQNVFQSFWRGVNNSLISQKSAHRQTFLARWLVASSNDQNKKKNVSKANQEKKCVWTLCLGRPMPNRLCLKSLQ